MLYLIIGALVTVAMVVAVKKYRQHKREMEELDAIDAEYDTRRRTLNASLSMERNLNTEEEILRIQNRLASRKERIERERRERIERRQQDNIAVTAAAMDSVSPGPTTSRGFSDFGSSSDSFSSSSSSSSSSD